MRWRILSLMPPAGMFSAPGTTPSASGTAFSRAVSTASDWAGSMDVDDLDLRDMFYERVSIYTQKKAAICVRAPKWLKRQPPIRWAGGAGGGVQNAVSGGK